jgi:hypothetical protein
MADDSSPDRPRSARSNRRRVASAPRSGLSGHARRRRVRLCGDTRGSHRGCLGDLRPRRAGDPRLCLHAAPDCRGAARSVVDRRWLEPVRHLVVVSIRLRPSDWFDAVRHPTGRIHDVAHRPRRRWRRARHRARLWLSASHSLAGGAWTANRARRHGHRSSVRRPLQRSIEDVALCAAVTGCPRPRRAHGRTPRHFGHRNLIVSAGIDPPRRRSFAPR